MAKSVSFGKRENEKKKASKRLEKQKRKEERKANPSSGSLDDMIAYVDENGMITSVPPSERIKEKEVIKLEDIAVSTPKKEDTGPVIYRGRVEHFNTDRGYGFIKDLDGTEKYFFHVSEAPENIAEGSIVSFETERGTKGMNAVRITL